MRAAKSAKTVAIIAAVVGTAAAWGCGGSKAIATPASMENKAVMETEMDAQLLNGDGSPVFKRARDFYVDGRMDSVIVVIREHLRKKGRDPEAYKLVPLVTEAYFRKGEYEQVRRLVGLYRDKFQWSPFLPHLTYLESIAKTPSAPVNNVETEVVAAPSYAKTSAVPVMTPVTNTKPETVATPPDTSGSTKIRFIAIVETEVDAQSGAAAGINPAEVRQITAVLRKEAVKNLPQRNYNIMTSETVIAQGGAVLEECSDENCVITLGSKIGADYIVRGTISKFGKLFTVSVDIYETEDGNLVASSELVRSENTLELLDKAAAACADMYKKFDNGQNSKLMAR